MNISILAHPTPIQEEGGDHLIGRRRRGRAAGVAKGPKDPPPAQVVCKRIRYAVEPYMVRPAMQEEIAVWLKEKLRSYIRHRGEVPSTALVP